jgi:isopentenyl-diphosphate delta-isomerase
VEHYRAKKAGDEFRQRLGENFRNWGIPTAVSLIETVQSVNLTVIASGGVRSGLDVAKALALGADLASTSLPVLQPATKSTEEVKKTLQFMIEELRNTMFLAGAKSIQDLRKASVVVTGKTAEWLRARGFNLELYAKRK